MLYPMPCRVVTVRHDLTGKPHVRSFASPASCLHGQWGVRLGSFALVAAGLWSAAKVSRTSLAWWRPPVPGPLERYAARSWLPVRSCGERRGCQQGLAALLAPRNGTWCETTSSRSGQLPRLQPRRAQGDPIRTRFEQSWVWGTAIHLTTVGSPCGCQASAHCRSPDPLGAVEGVYGSASGQPRRSRPPGGGQAASVM
jgi:hypothetical protein